MEIRQLERAVWREPSIVQFTVDPYIEERYGLKLSKECSIKRTAEGDKPLNMPFTSVLFASHNLDDDTWESFLIVDEGKDFADSTAKKLIEDDKVHCETWRGSVIRVSDRTEFRAERFYLMKENRASSFFKPSIYTPIDERCASDVADIDIEIMFSFNGALMPVVHTVRTGGAFGLTFFDIVHDILDDLSTVDDFMEFFTEEPSVIFDKDEGVIVFLLSGPHYTGDVFILYPEELNVEDLRGAITGFRMVDIRAV